MFTYRLMPLMRQGQEERDCCLGCVGGMPEEGLMFTYRLMPLMRQGQEERDGFWGVSGGGHRRESAVTANDATNPARATRASPVGDGRYP